MSSPKAPGTRNNLRYALAALVCALPFVVAAGFLQNYARRVDTLPLDLYAGLRWVPETTDLYYLHRSLQQSPPAETEVWRVTSNGTAFSQVGTLSADYTWDTLPMGSKGWVMVEGKDSKEAGVRMLCDLEGKVKALTPDAEWKPVPSKGDGIFYYKIEEALPFDQFVDVEEAPDMKPQLDGPSGQPTPEASATPGQPAVPTHKGVSVGEYSVEDGKMKPLLSIPYNNDSERPSIELMRRSPDGRFLAMVVKFGADASAGLWVHDNQSQRLLWTRVIVKGAATGLDWSPDSVKVAVTDQEGLVVLEQALGIESTRVDMSSTAGLQPAWGSGGRLYLYNHHAVHSVDIQGNVAEPILEKSDADDLRLNVAAARAAFSVTSKGFRELAIADLKSGQPVTESTYPGAAKQEAQSTLAYKVGSAIRFALTRWFG